MKVTKTLNILTSLHHVLHDTCTEHGKRHQDAVFWVDIDLGIKEGFSVLSDQDRTQLFFKEHSQPIVL